MNTVAIARSACGVYVKIYDYDDHDYCVITTGVVSVTKIFVSKCAGTGRAISRASEINGINCLEVIFDKTQND